MNDEKTLLIKISYSPTSGAFFIDYWAADGSRYYISHKLTGENEARGLSETLGIKILIQ